MLEKWISDATITQQKSVADWRQATELCARPLLATGLSALNISPPLSTSIKAGAVLCSGARSGDAACPSGGGAKGLGLSLLKLEEGVAFGAEEFDPVDVIVMLAAPISIVILR